MTRLEEASKDLLLKATVTSASLENASRYFASIGRPGFSQNFMLYSSVLDDATERFFWSMVSRGYGAYFLPNTEVPSCFQAEGMSYNDYRSLMFERIETAAGSGQAQTMNACLRYTDSTFQAAIQLAIKAAKAHDSSLLNEIAGGQRLLHAAALISLMVDESVGDATGEMLFIPDDSQEMHSRYNLATMEEDNGSGMVRYMPREFIFARMDSGSGLNSGQRLTIAGQEGHLSHCGSTEALDYVVRVVNRWHFELCVANGID